jgi:tRNA uridine 5-carboxymethylaminomethyl modification enzyme
MIDLLRRPELDYAALMRVPALAPAVEDPLVAEQVQIQAKYAGYLERQVQDVARTLHHEATAIPADFDYAAVAGLSAEVRQKLMAARPDSLGQAGRVAGVTPAAISLLLVHLRRRRNPGPRAA